MKRKKTRNPTALLKLLYFKLFKTHDTPHRKALGLGIGVFLGIIPGTGPLAALFVAMWLRVNRATALLGSLLTNTWMNIVTFLLAGKLGSAILNVDWQQIQQQWESLRKNFHFSDLLTQATWHILLPLFIGYCVIAFFLGCAAYLICLIMLTLLHARKKHHEDQNRINLSA